MLPILVFMVFDDASQTRPDSKGPEQSHMVAAEGGP